MVQIQALELHWVKIHDPKKKKKDNLKSNSFIDFYINEMIEVLL